MDLKVPDLHLAGIVLRAMLFGGESKKKDGAQERKQCIK
jgi:hypothetical protein